MDVSFAQLTVGGRGRFEFRVDALDFQQLTGTLTILSGGSEIGTSGARRIAYGMAPDGQVYLQVDDQGTPYGPAPSEQWWRVGHVDDPA